ncbi:MAG: hypothetical protein ACQKBY_00525 [Verrucomicrobiales bacterium]
MNSIPRSTHLLAGLGAFALLASSPSSEAALVIYVSESGPNVVFTWNGTIGDSGTGSVSTATNPTADFIDPINNNTTYAWSAADRSLSEVDSGGAGNWDAAMEYSGTTTSIYGSGSDNSGGTVSGGGLPFNVFDNGTLYVNTTESLATAVFSGTYTINGTLSSLGLFDTPATQATPASPLDLWVADSGAGRISFVVIPEPSTTLLGGLSLSLMLGMRRRA